MSLRDEWTFPYPADSVARAAQRKAEEHDERKDWWERERRDVLDELKRAGLEVTEYEVTGGQRHDVQFDPKLTKRLSEATSKIDRHRRDAERYWMFADVLGDQGDRSLDLHAEDVHYFGLSETARVS